MGKLKPSVAAYVDDNTVYGSDKKSFKEYRKAQRFEDRRKRREARAKLRLAKQKEKERKIQAWRIRKAQLYDHAHSQDRYAEAEYHVMNSRSHYTEKDVKRYERKLKNREYRRLVRELRKFRP